MGVLENIREKVAQHYWIFPVLHLLIGLVSAVIQCYNPHDDGQYGTILVVFSFLSIVCFIFAITEMVAFFAEKQSRKAIVLLLSELIALPLSVILFVFLPFVLNLDL
jgi:hypothetical protein